jgi:transposase
VEIKPKRRHHSKEFKLEALELAKAIGITSAARELGIHVTSIRTWKSKFEGPQKNIKSSDVKKSYSELEKENRRLQRENGYLKEINKVLKKSTAIFSSDHMGSLK